MPSLVDQPCNSPLLLYCSAARDKLLQKVNSLASCGKQWHHDSRCSGCSEPATQPQGSALQKAHYSFVTILQQISCRESTAWPLVGFKVLWLL